MLGRIPKNHWKWPFLLSINILQGPDSLGGTTATEKKADFSILQNETGWDRLKRMYLPDEFGELSSELTTISNVACMSLFVGTIYGGVVSSRIAYMDFIKNNQATTFRDHLEAKRKLQEKVTLSFGKGAFKWAWRLTLFSTSFMVISTTIGAYRNKHTVLEYVAAGSVSGTLYKFNMGPRGWIAGATLGAILGLVAGSATVGLLKLTGMSMDDVYYWQHYWRQERKRAIDKTMEKYLSEKDHELMKYHDERIAQGKEIANLDKK